MFDGAGALAVGAGFLLAAIRIGVLFVATPVFGGIPVPGVAKMLLILGLATVLPGVGAAPVVVPDSPLLLVGAVVGEVLLGAALAAGLFAGFGAFHFGGRLLDFQIGYGVANLVDIATRSSAPLLGTALSMVAALVFFAADGHLGVLKIFAMSFEAFPLGQGVAGLEVGKVVAQFSMCFSFGLLIVAPVVLSLMVVDFGMALMSRTMPQMNVFVMSLALKVLVGLSVLAIAIPFSGGVMRRVFEAVFRFWLAMVA